MLIIAPLFFIKEPVKKLKEITSIDLLDIGQGDEKAQRERIKAKQKQPKITSSKNPALSNAKDEKEQIGYDKEDAPEIKAGGKWDPKLMAVASYGHQLQQFIERNRYYPRRAQVMEQTGTVKMRLTIRPNGEFASVEILEGTDYDILNKAAKDLVTELKSFKPLPSEYDGNGVFIVPINYQLRGNRL